MCVCCLDDSLALDDDCVGGAGGVSASGTGAGAGVGGMDSGLMLARRYDVSITYGERHTHVVLARCRCFL